jgi:hypothetical protein
MTLQEFFDLLANNPILLIGFFLLVPITAWIACFLGRDEGHLPPWKYLYSTLIYLVCVPGIFAITLNIYLFLFEQRSILETDIFTQIIPVISMIATLLIIKMNVDLERIPGFDKLSGLLIMIFIILAIMWVIDSTRIFVGVFSFMPFWVVLAIFAGALAVARYGMKKFAK